MQQNKWEKKKNAEEKEVKVEFKFQTVAVFVCCESLQSTGTNIECI